MDLLPLKFINPVVNHATSINLCKIVYLFSYFRSTWRIFLKWGTPVMGLYIGETLNWEILEMDSESFVTFNLRILKIDFIFGFALLDIFAGLSRFPIPCL